MNKYAFNMQYVPTNNNIIKEEYFTEESFSYTNDEEIQVSHFKELETFFSCAVNSMKQMCASVYMFCMEKNGLTYETISKEIDEIVKRHYN